VAVVSKGENKRRVWKKKFYMFGPTEKSILDLHSNRLYQDFMDTLRREHLKKRKKEIGDGR
jgi:hypothetical protein